MQRVSALLHQRAGDAHFREVVILLKQTGVDLHVTRDWLGGSLT